MPPRKEYLIGFLEAVAANSAAKPRGRPSLRKPGQAKPKKPKWETLPRRPGQARPKHEGKPINAPVGTRVSHRQEVYFIIAGDTVKIGKTKNITARLLSLRTGISRPIDAVYVENDGHLDEYEVHHRFAKQRIHGEWFTLSDKIMSFIKEHKLVSIPSLADIQ